MREINTSLPEEFNRGRSSVAVENGCEGEAIYSFRTDDDVVLHLIPEPLNARVPPPDRRHARERRRSVDRNRGATVVTTTTTVSGIDDKSTAAGVGDWFSMRGWLVESVGGKAMKVRPKKRHDSVSQARASWLERRKRKWRRVWLVAVDSLFSIWR